MNRLERMMLERLPRALRQELRGREDLANRNWDALARIDRLRLREMNESGIEQGESGTEQEAAEWSSIASSYRRLAIHRLAMAVRPRFRRGATERGGPDERARVPGDVIAEILSDEEAAPMLRMRAAEAALDRAGWSADGKERRVALAIESEIDGLMRLLAEKLPSETVDAVIGVLNSPTVEPEKPAPRRPRVTVTYDDPDEDTPLEERISTVESDLAALKSQRKDNQP